MKKTTVKITAEEKTRWARILQRTWDAIAYDAIQSCGGECKRSEVVEFACDAGRPCENFGYGEVMTKEEYQVLCQWYGTASFKTWAREVFPCSSYVI